MKTVEFDGEVSISDFLARLQTEFGKPKVIAIKVKYCDNSISAISDGSKTTVSSERDDDAFLPLLTGAISGLFGGKGKKERSAATGDDSPASRKDLKKLYKKLVERLAPATSSSSASSETN